MDVKRLTRGPAIWVIVFVVLLIIGARVFAPNQYKKIDTYQALNLIKSDSVVSAKIVDRDQRIEAGPLAREGHDLIGFGQELALEAGHRSRSYATVSQVRKAGPRRAWSPW